MKTLFKLCFIVLLTACQSEINTKAFRPGEIWMDDKGEHINAHGGGILIFNDTYYWFGEHKIAGKAGNKAQVGVSCYSSKNLKDWKNEGIALKVIENEPNHDIAIGCVLERPKVIFNEKTHKFVMWFHLELTNQGYSAARTALAVADKVTGPYTFVKSLRPNAGHWPQNFTDDQKNEKYDFNVDRWTDKGRAAVVNGMFVVRDFEGGQMSRDMTLFVDDDGKAYHIASSEDNATLHISELSDNYQDFTGKYTRVFLDKRNEAPAIFKHEGKYYLFSSGCTGWKPNAGRSAVADKIMGPWTELGNFCRGNEDEVKTTFWSQSTYVIPVIGKKNAFIYCGDRWRPDNAIDGRYIWLPVEWEDDKPIVKWYDQWNLSLFE